MKTMEVFGGSLCGLLLLLSMTILYQTVVKVTEMKTEERIECMVKTSEERGIPLYEGVLELYELCPE